MADVSVKMGVSGISQFKQGMADAAASVKTLDAAMKTNEKQLKATGDAEAFMASQTNLLQGKISALRNVAKNAEQALKQMEANGVKTTSKAYQDMQRKLVEAQGSILDAEQEMQNLGKSAVEAAGQTDQLATSLGGLNKKVSLEQVIGAVNSITTGMEKAAKKAVDLGKAIWENITDSARWSDDVATQAMMLNMDVEEYQKMKTVFDTVGEITVQEWQKAKLKVQQAINKPSDEQVNILQLLGIETHATIPGKDGMVQGAAREFEDVFWEIGETLRAKVASGELTQDMADVYANAIFGRGFAGLNSLFDMGREEFDAEVERQAAASEEAIKKNAELNDKLVELQSKFTALKAEVVSGLSPALTGAAEALGKVMDSILEYLQSPEGQAALDKLGTAVAGLFEDLTKINPDDVVTNFTTVFDKLTDGLKWLKDNWGDVKAGIEGIGIAFGVLKISEGVLEGLRLFNGLKGFLGKGGAGGGAGGAGSLLTGGGASSLTAIFKNAIIGALPALGSIALGTIAITAGAVILGGSFNAQKVLDDAKKTGDEQKKELQEFNETVAAVSKNEELKEAHAALAGYIVPGGKTGMEDLEDLQAFAQRYISFLRDFADDSVMDQVSDIVFDKGQEFAEEFYSAMEAVLAGENDYTGETQQKVMDMVTDIMYAVRQQMASEVIKVKLEPDAEGLQAILNGIKFTANVALTAGSSGVAGTIAAMFGNGGFANGLPMTPFDGWYFLHKDETVTPAREIAHRSYNSNLYIENMNMNNGQDADGLAARIAAQNRRTMSGYGS